MQPFLTTLVAGIFWLWSWQSKRCRNFTHAAALTIFLSFAESLDQGNWRLPVLSFTGNLLPDSLNPFSNHEVALWCACSYVKNAVLFKYSNEWVAGPIRLRRHVLSIHGTLNHITFGGLCIFHPFHLLSPRVCHQKMGAPPLHQPISSEALRGSRESDEERHVLLCSSCDGTLANGETQGLKRLKSYEKWHVPINLVYQRKTRGSTLSRRKWESKKAPRNNSGCWSAVGSPLSFIGHDST